MASGWLILLVLALLCDWLQGEWMTSFLWWFGPELYIACLCAGLNDYHNVH